MTLSHQLQTLETTGLIQLALEHPELEYLFRHVLVQDAAYESLLMSDRQRWHSVVARVLEQVFAEQLDEVAAELARHFLAAGETQQAYHYFRQAGDVAFAEYANTEAEQSYRQALKLTAVPADTAYLQSQLGEILSRLGRYDEAATRWQTAIPYYLASQQYPTICHLTAQLARVTRYQAHSHGGDTAEAVRLCEEALTAVPHHPETPELALLLQQTAFSYHANQQTEQANAAIQQALDIAERIGEPGSLAKILISYWQYFHPQDIDAVRQGLTQAASLATATNDLAVLKQVHDALALLEGEIGNMHQSRQHMQQAAQVAHRLGAFVDELEAWDGVLIFSWLLADFTAVQEAIDQMRQLARGLNYPRYAIYATRAQVLLLWGDGRLAEAAQLIQQMQPRQGEMEYDMIADYVFLLHRVGDGETAVAILQRTHDQIGLTPRTLGVEHHCTWSSHYSWQGKLDLAQQSLAAAETQFSQRHLEAALLDLARARLAAAQAQWDEAGQAYHRAATTLQQMSMNWHRLLALEEWATTFWQSPAHRNQAQTIFTEAENLAQTLQIGYLHYLRQRWQQLIGA